jgi:Uma2 family endonuclease
MSFATLLGMGERRFATYDDVLAAPADVVAEVVAGRLHTHPRPRLRHAAVATTLGEELGPPFRRGRGGPGGWVLLDEPELHLGDDIVVPDLAGWRRERMPEVPDEPFTTIAPDWVCEVLSARTAAFDRTEKLSVYARESVRHVWFLDPDPRVLEVLRLDGETYRIVLTRSGDVVVSAEPFDAVGLDLTAVWRA